jgi:hypothetical protein
MTSSDVFVSSAADLEGRVGSLAGLVFSVSDVLLPTTLGTSGLDGVLTSVGVDVTGVFSLVAVAGVVEPGVEVPVAGEACDLAFVLSEVTGGPGFF